MSELLMDKFDRVLRSLYSEKGKMYDADDEGCFMVKALSETEGERSKRITRLERHLHGRALTIKPTEEQL